LILYERVPVLQYINTSPFIGTNNRTDVDMEVVSERYRQLEIRKNKEHDDDEQFEHNDSDVIGSEEPVCILYIYAFITPHPHLQFQVDDEAISSNVDEQNYVNDDIVDDVWYEMNDTQVTRVDESVVLKQQAYMLFYERQ
jgi:hypothetical protein